MPNHPTKFMLCIGLAAFVAAFGTSYIWAENEPPNEDSNPEPTGQNAPIEQSSEDETIDPAELSFTDWEEFEGWDGSRRQMVGIGADQTVNFRQGPGLENDVIDQLNGRQLLARLDRWGDWYLTQAQDGTVGWIHRDPTRLLNIPEPVATRFQEDLPDLGKAFASQLPDSMEDVNRVQVVVERGNFRSGAGTQYSLLRRVHQGEQLELLAFRSRWYRVRTVSGQLGWLHENLVEPVWASNVTEQELPIQGEVRLRLGPSSSYRGDKIPSDQRPLMQVGQKGEWMQVRLPNGRIGWTNPNN